MTSLMIASIDPSLGERLINPSLRQLLYCDVTAYFQSFEKDASQVPMLPRRVHERSSEFYYNYESMQVD